MIKFALPVALFSALVLPLAARADTFNFSTSGAGGGFSGSGVIDATNQGSYYSINSIAGGNASTGSTVTGLIGANGFDGNDNELFPASALLVDNSGFAFTASQINPTNQGNTSFTVRIYSSGGSYFLDLKDSDGFSNGAIPANLSIVNATPAQTPEPSGLLLLGTGVLSMAGMARRRFARA